MTFARTVDGQRGTRTRDRSTGRVLGYTTANDLHIFSVIYSVIGYNGTGQRGHDPSSFGKSGGGDGIVTATLFVLAVARDWVSLPEQLKLLNSKAHDWRRPSLTAVASKGGPFSSSSSSNEPTGASLLDHTPDASP